jgi:hypothetical protein
MRVGQAKMAVLVPCYNEDLTVADAVATFQISPGRGHLRLNNHSTDDTRGSGARRAEPRQGKGHLIRRVQRR